MKSSQWIGAVVAVAVVVFGITFFRNYTFDSSTPESRPIGTIAMGPELDFATTFFPPDGADGPVPLVYEVHKQGTHDFWFENPHKLPVTIGLNRKTCKCTTVELFVLNDAWKSRRSELEQAAPGDKIWSELSASVPATHLERIEQGGKVPAGATGFVRLTWTGEKAGPQNLSAELWQGRPDGSQTQKLEVRLHFVNSLSVDPLQLDTGLMTQSDLPRTVTFHCFSETRENLPVKVTSVNSRWKPEQDPITVETIPIKDQAELDRLQAAVLKESSGKIKCAYKILVTLRPQGQDGQTSLEMGVFGRRFEIRTQEEGIEPVQFLLVGALQGPVIVGSPEDMGKLVFNGFYSDRGAQKGLTLQSDIKGLKLEVDRGRTAEFLDATLEPPQVTASGRQIWRLNVKVPPRKAHGLFPRQDHPVYRDSAVYVTIRDGDKTQSIRIPAQGEATDR